MLLSKNRNARKLQLRDGREWGQYAGRLQMYKIPPIDNISLEQFEEMAIERLKVLREVESNSIRYKKDSKLYEEKSDNLLISYMPMNYKSKLKETFDPNDEYDERRKDHISHFILRLAYCRSEELRRWFLTQEVELFRIRFSQEERKQIDTFLEHNKLSYTDISEKEKTEKSDKLRDSGYNLSKQSVQADEYYKVPFIEALDLVRSRKVYLEGGYAYVPRGDLSSIISNVFRTNLSHALALTARALPYLEEDERLLPRLNNLSRQYVGQDYGTKKSIAGGKITLDQIDVVSHKSYPLCMRNLHQSLREAHHLKHGGRMQYGLFLKGIGITLEESLIFWRSEFGKMMELDKFDKQYAYNIRHNYGKEGKRADYTPYSCLKIIMSNQPGPGDCHGCPYRHTDPDLLRQRLSSHQVGKEGIDEDVHKLYKIMYDMLSRLGQYYDDLKTRILYNQIMNLVKESHYQLACTKYFEIGHVVENQPGFNHPNQYYEESRKILAGATPNSQNRVKQTPRANVKKESQQSDMKTENDEAFEELDDMQLMSMDVDGLMTN